MSMNQTDPAPFDLMDMASFVFVPTLHRELRPTGLPEELAVLSIWPGLPDSRGIGDGKGWFRPELPYSPAQAAACLVDFAALDEDSLGSVGDVDSGGAASSRQSAHRRQEKNDLARFAQTGTAERVQKEKALEEVNVPVVAQEEARRWAQRFLLLGWLQEERALEMDALLIRYKAGADRLAAQLGDRGNQTDESPEERLENGPERETVSELLAAMHDLIPEDPAALLPSWRFMMDLLGVLLPPELPLFTADGRMVSALTEAGLCQEPLSEAFLARLALGASSARLRLTCGRLPLWKILGKEPQADRPWLDSPRLLVVFHTNLE